MPFDQAMKSVQQLTRHAETLAAIGALLSARTGAGSADDLVSAKLHAIQEAIDPGLLEDLAGEEAQFLRALILANLRRVLAFAESPETPAQWSTDDPVILQTQGRSSRIVTRLITEFASREPALSTRLGKAGRFLDVGCGVGWISITMAEQWPALTVDGLDIHPPALDIANENIAASSAAGRIKLQEKSVADVDDVGSYAAAFVPFIFIPQQVLAVAIPALSRAIERDGWLFVACYRPPEEPLQHALVDLQATLSGGRMWTEQEVGAILGPSGFHLLEDIGAGTGINLYAARKR